jgi:ABC-2 type transport system permease protein
VPIGDLPAPLGAVASLLPVGALSDAFASALGSGGEIAAPLAIVGVWAIGSLAVAARTFRWD